MSTSSNVALGALRIQAQQRSDMENNDAVTTPEWNQYISQSYKELYDLLTSAYGNDYYVAETYQFIMTSAQQYPMPDGSPTYQNTSNQTAQKFYKLLGVDLQYSASPSGWVTLKRFEFIDRNRYAYPNTTTNFNGYTNLRYRVQGDGLYFMPVPQAGQLIQTWYAPAPTSLQFMLPCVTTLNSTSITLADTTGLSVGMNVSGTSVPDNTVISSVGSASMVVSNAIRSTQASAILSMWSDSTELDGIAGWEEYIVIDAAIKAQIKQENDYTPLGQQKADMKTRIEAMAEGRDIGQAQHVSDALGATNFGPDGWGSGGGSDWGGY